MSDTRYACAFRQLWSGKCMLNVRNIVDSCFTVTSRLSFRLSLLKCNFIFHLCSNVFKVMDTIR